MAESRHIHFDNLGPRIISMLDNYNHIFFYVIEILLTFLNLMDKLKKINHIYINYKIAKIIEIDNKIIANKNTKWKN